MQYIITRMKAQKNVSSHRSQRNRHSKVCQHKTASDKQCVQSRKTQSKNVSAKQVVQKIVSTLTPHEQSKQELKSANQHEKKLRDKLLDVPFAESSAANTTRFFYTSDDIIDSFDDQQLYAMIAKQFSGLLATEKNDHARKNAMLDMLNDIDFMNDVLEQYNMTILDFFKFLFRLCPSTFKGMFVKKLQNTVKDKPYAQSLRFGKYKSSTQRKRTKRCSIF